MGNKKDLSGFDVIIDNPKKAIPYSKSNPAPPKTFNMSDVSIRWNCSTGQVKKAISSGLPMTKKPNGRWEITEPDLVAWERMRNEQAEREARSKRNTKIVVTIICAISIITISIFVFAYVL